MLTVAALIGVVALARRGDGRAAIVASSTSSSPAPSTSTGLAPLDDPPLAFAGLPVWPLDGRGVATAEEAATTFARDYLGFADPTATVSGRAARVQPDGRSGPTTSVSVFQQDDGWVVTGADSDQVTVGNECGPAPSTYCGTSTAFQGTVQVQLRRFGEVAPLTSVPVQGGSNGGKGMWSATLDQPRGTPLVVVALVPDPSGRGSALAATVQRLHSLPEEDAAAAFDGRMYGQRPAGRWEELTSAGGTAIDAPPSVVGPAAVAGPLRTRPLAQHRTPDLDAYVGGDGRTVYEVDLVTGERSKLFTAGGRITSVDADVIGGLLYTDDQLGLWRWDSPAQPAPVKVADGYRSAAW